MGGRGRSTLAQALPESHVKDPMEDLLTKQWARLSPYELNAMRTGASELVRAFGEEIRWGSACSGTDLVAHVLDKVLGKFSRTFGLTIKPKQVFACEKDPAKAPSTHQTSDLLDSLFSNLAITNPVH